PQLVKIHLANYFAGALLMPYEDVFREAQRTRYDVEGLAGLFEMSYEAIGHRLTNLSDARRRGGPMHFRRVDVGGNLPKRHSAGPAIRRRAPRRRGARSRCGSARVPSPAPTRRAAARAAARGSSA